jgi:hypothetical protein
VTVFLLERGPHGGGPTRGMPLRGCAALWLASALCASGCAEEERPAPLPDVPSEVARRVLTGSIGAPPTDAGAAPGGARSDAGDGADPATGGTGAAGVSSDTRVEPTASGGLLAHQIYEGRCDPPAVVQWGFFTYQALTPGDSIITFEVRSAPSEAELVSAASFELLTASTALGTTRCGVTGPAPCPLDLFTVLGGAPLVHHPIAELAVLLSPASDGTMPRVEQWRLDYSCTFNQ